MNSSIIPDPHQTASQESSTETKDDNGTRDTEPNFQEALQGDGNIDANTGPIVRGFQTWRPDNIFNLYDYQTQGQNVEGNPVYLTVATHKGIAESFNLTLRRPSDGNKASSAALNMVPGSSNDYYETMTNHRDTNSVLSIVSLNPGDNVHACLKAQIYSN